MVTGDLAHPPLSIRMVVFYNPPPPPSVALCPIRTAHYAKVLRVIIMSPVMLQRLHENERKKHSAREKRREGGGTV